jgi:hypothetical protein
VKGDCGAIIVALQEQMNVIQKMWREKGNTGEIDVSISSMLPGRLGSSIGIGFSRK